MKWRAARGRAAHAAGWPRVLLVIDPELGTACDDAVRVAVAITSPGGTLHVLAPVLIPLSTPLGAPPGAETDRAEACLEHVERLAGRYGLGVRAHLLRGRAMRGLLRELARETAPQVVVVRAAPPRCRELAVEVGAALPVLLPGEGEVFG